MDDREHDTAIERDPSTGALTAGGPSSDGSTASEPTAETVEVPTHDDACSTDNCDDDTHSHSRSTNTAEHTSTPLTSPTGSTLLSPGSSDDSCYTTALRQHGIKVRDFALDPNPDVHPAPTMSNPLLELIEYDDTLAESPRTKPIRGRTIRRLLEMGWVSQDEAQKNLSDMDWAALAEYDATPFKQAWKPIKVNKPSDDERERGRLWRARGTLASLRNRVKSPGLLHRFGFSSVLMMALAVVIMLCGVSWG